MPMTTSVAQPPWAVTPEKLSEAVRRLVEAAHPRRIILLGSHARGDAHPDSDVDLMLFRRKSKTRRRNPSGCDACSRASSWRWTSSP